MNDRPLTPEELDSFRTVEDVLTTADAARYRREQATRAESNAIGARLFPSMPPEPDPPLPDLREQHHLRKLFPSMWPPERR